VQIRNNQLEDFEIEYYEITSAAGSLNFANWTSLDDQEGDPDLIGWDEAAGNSAELLSEYRLLSTTSVAPATSLSLGQAFQVASSQDLRFYVGLADGTLVRGIVDYVPGGLTGDYNSDNVVDAADYVVWRKNAGTTNSLPNDPVGGTIGAAQYEHWRTNLGNLAGGAAPFHSVPAVPESSSLSLLALAALFAVGAYRW
jgi:hypothetical protein